MKRIFTSSDLCPACRAEIIRQLKQLIYALETSDMARDQRGWLKSHQTNGRFRSALDATENSMKSVRTCSGRRS